MDYFDIFISYRRDGGDDLAVLLEERLSRMGYKVFLDVESLRSGDFNEALLTAIDHSIDFLLVLPEHGLDRCIDNPKDWVRREIAYALSREKNVIPIMKRNFVFPENLPEDIAKVASMNGVAAGMEDFNSTINRLVTKFLHSKPYENDEVHQLEIKAEKGDPKAMNELALRLEFGDAMTASNTRKAFEYFQKAADRKYLPALFNLAEIYEKCCFNFSLLKDYGIEVDLELDRKGIQKFLMDISRQYLEASAKAGYAPSLFKLGNQREQQGEYREALMLYRQAADQHFPPALNSVGYYYQNGIEVSKDLDSARAFYRQAAELQEPAAIYNLALLLQNESPLQALDLLRKVAYGDYALPEAAYALGKLYESFQDINNAMHCYSHACQLGVHSAQADLERCRFIM